MRGPRRPGARDVDLRRISAGLGLLCVPLLITVADVATRAALGSERLGSIFGPLTLLGAVADVVVTTLALRRCRPSMRRAWRWITVAAFAVSSPTSDTP
jgi:type IV secretory pathway VirB2 component (pilin)